METPTLSIATAAPAVAAATAEDWKNQSWYKNFEKSYTESKNRMDAIHEVWELYDSLRRDKLRSGKESTAGERGVSGDEERWRKMDSALQQKSKQIEGQQALLTDLQAQLGLKENEVRDLSARLATSVAQASQVQLQLQFTHKRLQEQELEVIRLRNELLTLEKKGDSDVPDVEHQVNRANVPSAVTRLSEYLPQKVVKMHQLGKSDEQSPNFVVTTPTASGPQLVLVGTRKLHCFNALSGNIVCEADIVNSASASLMSACVSPENDLALVGTSESQLSLIDLNGRVLKDLKGHTGKIKGCGFLGSKQKGFSVSTDRTLKQWDLTRASPIRSVPVVSQLTGGVATMDGTMVVTCHLNGKITVWSLNDKVCEFTAHSEACLGVTLSPDGRFIVSVGKDDTVSITDLHMAQSGPVHSLTGFKALPSDGAPSVSSDSKIVSVCGSAGIASWDLLLGTPIGTVSTDATSLAWATGSISGGQAPYQLITAHPKGIVKWWSP